MKEEKGPLGQNHGGPKPGRFRRPWFRAAVLARQGGGGDEAVPRFLLPPRSLSLFLPLLLLFASSPATSPVTSRLPGQRHSFPSNFGGLPALTFAHAVFALFPFLLATPTATLATSPATRQRRRLPRLLHAAGSTPSQPKAGPRRRWRFPSSSTSLQSLQQPSTAITAAPSPRSSLDAEPTKGRPAAEPAAFFNNNPLPFSRRHRGRRRRHLPAVHSTSSLPKAGPRRSCRPPSAPSSLSFNNPRQGPARSTPSRLKVDSRRSPWHPRRGNIPLLPRAARRRRSSRLPSNQDCVRLLKRRPRTATTGDGAIFPLFLSTSRRRRGRAVLPSLLID